MQYAHQLETEQQAQQVFQDLRPSALCDVDERIRVIKAIEDGVKDNAKDILIALHKDLHRAPHESCVIELYPLINDMSHVRRNLKNWIKSERLPRTMVHTPGVMVVDKVPLGKGLIIVPFNFPFFLSIPYVVMAIAAGNAVCVRPSNKTPNCSEVISRILNGLQRPDIVQAVECAYDISDYMLELPWDKIFYTGSTQVAKHIMELSAPNLVPVTLELGGKSPCIVTENAELSMAAKRIAFSKTCNCGQICVAPDYVLIQRDIMDSFVGEMVSYWATFFGADPKTSPDYPRMITTDATQRIRSQLLEAEAKPGVHLCCGGAAQIDVDNKYVPPTILTCVPEDVELMKKEIFGPVLPVIPFDSLEEAVQFVTARPKPLALYVFTASDQEQQMIREKTTSGDLVINDCLMHVMHPSAPFGGVGPSGMGVAHGYQAFLGWCQLRTIYTRPAAEGLARFDRSVRWPPYVQANNKLSGKLICRWSVDSLPTDEELATGISADMGVVGPAIHVDHVGPEPEVAGDGPDGAQQLPSHTQTAPPVDTRAEPQPETPLVPKVQTDMPLTVQPSSGVMVGGMDEEDD